MTEDFIKVYNRVLCSKQELLTAVAKDPDYSYFTGYLYGSFAGEIREAAYAQLFAHDFSGYATLSDLRESTSNELNFIIYRGKGKERYEH